jgi:hypothetical protein
MKTQIARFATGAVVALAALAALGVAGTAIWAHVDKRDSSGYYTTHAHRYATATRALVTAKVDVDGDIPNWVLDKVRVRVEPVGDRRVFAGLARTEDVRRYLAGVAHTEVSDVDLEPFDVTYVAHPGARTAPAPETRRFWRATAAGTGARDLVWKPSKGDWSVVVMNADGSAGVAADVSVGANAPIVLWAAIGAAGIGIALAGLAAFLVRLGARRRPGPPAVPAAVQTV